MLIVVRRFLLYALYLRIHCSCIHQNVPSSLLDIIHKIISFKENIPASYTSLNIECDVHIT